MVEPVWIPQAVVPRIHAATLERHGGADGVRDAGLLESALQRPANLWHYSQPKPDVPSLAASLAHGVVKNHPFFDGNKRTAWVLCRLMLRLNGVDIAADHAEKSDAVLALASSEWTAEQFADWLRNHLDHC